MATDRWKQIDELFHAALDLTPDHRSKFLKERCDDPLILQEVDSLIQAHNQAGSFIETPIDPNYLDQISQAEDLLMPEEIVGDYKIIKEIRRGGMGAVYLAVRADQAFEKYVAVKLLKRGMDTVEVLRHFQTERQILADFDHPNIARLLDGGTTSSGLPYFVMEYVEGMPIDTYCDSQMLSVADRLELFRQVCAAVSYAHRHLVIHRDIKPSNILVTPDRTPKLLDFGIAKILDSDRQTASTATGIRLMTPEYASPEQALGLPVTTVSDVYSLGVLLYELLTGRSPHQFKTRSPLEVARVLQNTPPILPSASVDRADSDVPTAAVVSNARSTSADQLKRRLRGDLDNIVTMALRKEPQRRYQSADQLSEDIRRHLVGLPVLARSDTIVYRMTKFVQRNKIGVGAAVLVLLTLIGGIVTTIWQAQNAKTEQKRAEYAREFGDELRYLESLMLSTYTAPLHDIRPKIRLAQSRLRRIQGRMEEGGQWAYGSGHNALGNGYLILKDYEKAKLHLEMAWSSGYQDPSTAFALGKTLGNLYLQALQKADDVSNREMREQEIKDAEIQYAQQAVAYLDKARAHAESPAYVEGLIALYKKRYDDALRKASDALHSSSRPYEVLKLQGDIHFEIARSEAEKAVREQAMRSFEQAGDAYLLASQNARSDPDIYLADAQRYTRVISLHIVKAVEPVRLALQQCDQAITIQPDDDRPYLVKSEVYLQQGINLTYQSGEDPRPAFRQSIQQAEEALRRKETVAAHNHVLSAYVRIGEYETPRNLDPRDALTRAIASSERAIQLDPHYAETYMNRASAYFYLAEYELLRGNDPTTPLTKIIDTYNGPLASFPKDAFSYNLLGLASIGLAEYKMKRGKDPRPNLQTAISEYGEGLKLYPKAGHLIAKLGLAFWDLAKFESTHGIDPEKSFQQAIHYNVRSLEMNPAAQETGNLGLVHLSRAEHKFRVREDPEPDLKLATEKFQRMMELHPDFPHSDTHLASVHVLRARHLLLAGKSPEAELVQARKILNDSIRRDPSNSDSYLVLGTANSLLGRHSMLSRKSSDPWFDQAIENLEKCLEINSQELGAYLELARISLWRAERSSTWIERGLHHVLEAEQIHPQHPEILAIHSKLLHLKARLSNSSDLEKQSTELLQRALQGNRFLESDYGN